MEFAKVMLIFVAFFIGCYILVKFLDWLLGRRIRLSRRVKSKARRKYRNLLRRFKEEKQREPTNSEKFWIVVNASHITIRRRGSKGHWGRQKVRKYLAEKHKIVKDYKIR